MTVELSPEIHHKIFNDLKSIFSDFHFFNNLIADKLYQAIKESNYVEINMKTTRKVAERYFDEDSFRSTEQKLLWAQIQIIFRACYVLIYSYHEYPKSLMWSNTNLLLENYPEFNNLDDEELGLLLNFRNMLRITILLIPARLNKQCILKIVARLEGSQNEYITGGGQKPAVTRRVRIYEKESGIVPEARPCRKRPEKIEHDNVKRSLSSFSEKKVKLIRMASNDLEILSKPPAFSFPMKGLEITMDNNNDDMLVQSINHTTKSKSRNNKMNSKYDLLDFMSPLSALSAAAVQLSNEIELQNRLKAMNDNEFLPTIPPLQRMSTAEIFESLITSDHEENLMNAIKNNTDIKDNINLNETLNNKEKIFNSSNSYSNDLSRSTTGTDYLAGYSDYYTSLH